MLIPGDIAFNEPLETLTRSIDELGTECIKFDALMRNELVDMLEFAQFDKLFSDNDLPPAIMYDVWRRILMLQNDKYFIQFVELWTSRPSHRWHTPFTVVNVRSLPV